MDNPIERWGIAQSRASTPNDWEDIDRLAIAASEQEFSCLRDVNQALRLAVSRLVAIDDDCIGQGEPPETWIEHLLRSLWLSLTEIERIQNSFDSLPFAAHSIGRDTKIIAVSKPWCDLLGYRPESAIGHPSVEFLTEASRKDALEVHLPKFWAVGAMSQVEYTMVAANGNEVPVFMSAASEFGADGKPTRSFAVISKR